jgi:CMP-N,N'-diacetyllegionaminic acid synthase
MIAALITARGLHIEFKDNALLPILGRPILAYPYLAACHARSVDQVFLSSDGAEIKLVGENLGMEFIHRPSKFSRETIGHREVIQHALRYISDIYIEPEILVVLLGNVATHEVGIVDKCIEVLTENPQVDSCVTVSERNEFHPLRAKRMLGGPIAGNYDIGSDFYEIKPFLDVTGTVSTNRQDLEPVYFLNHAVWALRPKVCFASDHGQWPGSFVGQTVVGIETDHGIDIRSIEDVAFSERWLMNHGWTMNNSPYWSD